jgi:hypothetical protein
MHGAAGRKGCELISLAVSTDVYMNPDELEGT